MEKFQPFPGNVHISLVRSDALGYFLEGSVESCFRQALTYAEISGAFSPDLWTSLLKLPTVSDCDETQTRWLGFVTLTCKTPHVGLLLTGMFHYAWHLPRSIHHLRFEYREGHGLCVSIEKSEMK